jgi:cyclophilin family peptidyl-prolyl cis-trans isomerase
MFGCKSASKRRLEQGASKAKNNRSVIGAFAVELFEPRLFLSATIPAPAVATDWAVGSTLTPTITVPIGKSLVVPLTDGNTSGQPLTYNVQSNNPNITATVHTGNEFIDLHVTGFATGDLVFELFNDLTPVTADEVSSFVRSGFYDNIIFHRVLAGFVAQAGDPTAASEPTTAGQYGPFNIPDEITPSLLYDGDGQLGIARSGHDTNSTQIFITQGPQRFLDYNYTIFGQLVSGFDVFNQIMQVPVNTSTDYPDTPVTITSATVIQDTNDAVITVTAAPGTSPNDTASITVTTSDGQGNTSTPLNFTVEAVTDPATDSVGDPIDDQPFINTPQTQSATFGTSVAPSINLTTPVNTPKTFTVTATDITGAADTISATVTDSQPNGTVQVGSVVTGGTTNTASVTVTPDANFTGVITVQVSVERNDDSNESATSVDTKTYNIAVGDQPLTITDATPTQGGSANSYQLVTFTDADSAAQAADFTATINWGNGTPAVAGTVVATSGGGFAVVGTNNSAAVADGNYTAIVNIQSVAGAAATVTTTSPETTHPIYVTQLYHDFLGRGVDPVGLAHWTNFLDDGGTYAALANAITGSVEYDTNIVNNLYETYLHRAPDPTGITAWVGELQSGLNADVIRAGILGSDEYYNDAGGTDSDFITALYESFLGRAPENAPTGLPYWLGVLQTDQANGMTAGQARQAVSASISQSGENLDDVATSFYETYLHRAPDPAGLAYWEQELAAGVSQPFIVSAFVSSPEYLADYGITV